MSKIALKLVEDMQLSWDYGQVFHTDSIYTLRGYYTHFVDISMRHYLKSNFHMDDFQKINKYNSISHVIFYPNSFKCIKNKYKIICRTWVHSWFYFKSKWYRIQSLIRQNEKRLENYFQRALQLASGSKAFGTSI